MTYKNQHILVLGLGESGVAMAKWLVVQSARLRVADSRSAPPGVDALRQVIPTAEIVCGAFTEALLQDVDLLAVSPGISTDDPIVCMAHAKGIPVTGETELFAQALQQLKSEKPSKIIAITGTNGKTTTTTLTGALCRAAGLDVAVAGNISPAALQELMARLEQKKLPDVWILELSSFQLETTSSLKADAAVVLNVTDDHLDRHGSMADYAAIKSRIFMNCNAQVLNRDDLWTSDMARQGYRQFSFGLSEPRLPNEYGVLEHDGQQWLAMMSDAQVGEPAKLEFLIPCSQLLLAGSHNVANVLAALALCESIGLNRAVMLQALQQFKGLPHRVEWVARRDDHIDFYDDSKGTNVGATVAALRGLGRKVVLIAGGDGKGQDFRPLSEVFKKHARAVILIGKDAKRIEEETAECGITLIHAADLDVAVQKANEHAQTGDAILLSPACASMDMFRNYAHRAQVFIDAVKQLPGVTWQ